MKTREQAEARAWELFPDVPITIENMEELANHEKRQGFLKCWEEMQKDKQTCGFCVEPASKTIKEAFDKIPKDVRDRHAKAAYNEHKLLREAAEKVVDYALYGGLGVNLHDAIVELEKALK